MMSSLMPDKTGIYGNVDTLSGTIPCFTHALVEAGYETVLAGRMHFLGVDQRHGFTKRIAPDITPVSWTYPSKQLEAERGLLNGISGDPWCCDMVGAGESNVMHYDRMVVDATLRYLLEEHEKPQFILIGTYSPHFPYIIDEEMYLKYLKRAKKPAFFDMDTLPEYVKDFPLMQAHVRDERVTWDVAKGCVAAYCGMIERMDMQIGEIWKALKTYAKKQKRSYVLGYLSDHGDTVGERRMFGKKTFFEKSVKIPLIFYGESISKGKEIFDPVNIIDLGPTLCALAGATFDIGDGVSLTGYLDGSVPKINNRMITSQFMEQLEGRFYGGLMIRYKQYKYVIYHGFESYELLFDLDKDPGETENLYKEMPDLAAWFAERTKELIDFERMEELSAEHRRNTRWFQIHEREAGLDDSERWKDNPPSARGQLSIAAAYRDSVPEMKPSKGIYF